MVRIFDILKNLKQKRREKRQKLNKEKQEKQELLEKLRLEKQELSENLVSFHKRFNELDAAMGRLVSEHMVVNSIEEYYSYISDYVNCRNSSEYNYCKNYIKSKIRNGYKRFDDERLK
jgi:hypothetical protein